MAIRKRNRITSEFSLSAMTDIIFMLLIFFILTSTVSPEPILKIILPKGVQTDHLAVDPIIISLNAQGEYAVNNQKNITIESLPLALESELKKNLTAPVSIHADKSVMYEKVMELVSIANKKGAKVVLALDKETSK
ncbi:MAG: biopolymer transporter ExbD [bacterium]|nr:biopolymer transporter ExbD [bacterium]